LIEQKKELTELKGVQVEQQKITNHLLSEQTAQKKEQVALRKDMGTVQTKVGDLDHEQKLQGGRIKHVESNQLETNEEVAVLHGKTDYLRERQQDQDDTMEFQQSAIKGTQSVVKAIYENLPSGEGKDKVKIQAKKAGIRLSDASSVKPCDLDNALKSRGRASDASDGSGGFGSGLVNDVVSPPASKRAKVVDQDEEKGLKPAAKESSDLKEGDSNVVSFGDQDAIVPLADQDEQDESKQEGDDSNNFDERFE